MAKVQPEKMPIEQPTGPGQRLFAPAEETDLAGRFGREWDAYCRRVKVAWL